MKLEGLLVLVERYGSWFEGGQELSTFSGQVEALAIWIESHAMNEGKFPDAFL